MKKKLSGRALYFILLTAFLNMMGIGIIIPVVPFLVQKFISPQNINEVALTVGFLVSVYALCQFLAAPALGLLSDRYGRKPVLLFSLAGSAVGYILLGAGGALWVLFLGRIIDGLTGGNISTIFAYIGDTTEPADRAKYYGYIGGVMGFGFMIGPALGGLTAHINLSAPFYIAALITAVNIVWGYFSLPESLPKEHRLEKFEAYHLNPFGSFGKVLSHPTLRTLLIIGFFYYFPFAQLQGNGSVIMKDAVHFQPAMIGTVFFVVGAVDIVVQGFLVRKIVGRIGEVNLSIFGLLFMIIGYGLYTMLPVLRMAFIPFAGAFFFALGGGLIEPSLNGLISHTAGPKEQGMVQGANQSMQSISRVLGPIMAGGLYSLNWSTPYIVSIFLTLFAGSIIFSKKKDMVSRPANF